MLNPSLPNFIIAGVNKAATTSVFMYLSQHPDICPSSIKEVQYFLPVRYRADQLPPIEEYLQYFNHCGQEKYRMEATGKYFYGGQKTARIIKDTCGDINILLTFRNPVDRLFSFLGFRNLC